MGRRRGTSAFPVARIKKMMQSDDEVGKIATVTPMLVAKALECMMEVVVTEAARVAIDRRSRTVTPLHLKTCVMRNNDFDFLRHVFRAVDGVLEDNDVEDDDEDNDDDDDDDERDEEEEEREGEEEQVEETEENEHEAEEQQQQQQQVRNQDFIQQTLSLSSSSSPRKQQQQQQRLKRPRSTSSSLSLSLSLSQQNLIAQSGTVVANAAVATLQDDGNEDGSYRPRSRARRGSTTTRTTSSKDGFINPDTNHHDIHLSNNHHLNHHSSLNSLHAVAPPDDEEYDMDDDDVVREREKERERGGRGRGRGRGRGKGRAATSASRTRQRDRDKVKCGNEEMLNETIVTPNVTTTMGDGGDNNNNNCANNNEAWNSRQERVQAQVRQLPPLKVNVTKRKLARKIGKEENGIDGDNVNYKNNNDIKSNSDRGKRREEQEEGNNGSGANISCGSGLDDMATSRPNFVKDDEEDYDDEDEGEGEGEKGDDNKERENNNAAGRMSVHALLS